MHTTRQHASLLSRHPAAVYFLCTFAVSWLGAFALVAPRLLQHQAIPKFTGLMMFPVMLLGPSLMGLLLTRLADGRAGLSDLLARMRRLAVAPRWFAVLLIPPVAMLAVLLALRTGVSPTFTPNFFPVGLAFGCIAGFAEEIGWTGFAYPKLRAGRNGLLAAILLGLLWGLWHLPVVDYLGTATPHGAYWGRYFLAFIAAMSAMRVLICWLFARTGSVLLAQMLHAVSTGCLVVLSPPHVSAGQEAAWYAIYAVVLWLIVLALVAVQGAGFLNAPAQPQPE